MLDERIHSLHSILQTYTQCAVYVALPLILVKDINLIGNEKEKNECMRVVREIIINKYEPQKTY
jgi:hypothetical protein